MVKNLPVMQETWVWSLGWEGPLEEDMATHSSILAWRIPWTEEPAGLQSIGLQRVGHDWSDLARIYINYVKALKINKSRQTLKANMLVAQSCLILCNPMDCSPPGSSVQGILQARILEWVAMPFSRQSCWPRDRTWVSYIAGRFFTICEPPAQKLGNI